MTDCRIAFATVCLLTAVSTAQAGFGRQPNAEQIEAGIMPCPTVHPADSHAPHSGNLLEHPLCRYKIRLLPLSSFPQLPVTVTQKLEARGCMIPQTYEANGPENVISGSFEKPGSSDWAALCSVRGTTTLYVFFGSDLSHPIALRRQPDNLWLGVEPTFDYGSAWGILTVPARAMPRTDEMDHDGIEDAFVERSSVVHYYADGRWTTLGGDD